MGLGIKSRKEQLEKYFLEHDGRETFDRVSTRMNIRSIARVVVSLIMECLYTSAPVETGFGRSAGIRYKQNTIMINGKRKKLRNNFTIYIGSRYNAYGGQTDYAPYMAIQNFLPSNEGWILDGINKARRKIKRNKLNSEVYINNPKVISHYITQNGTVRPSGYSIDVIFME